jgi:hypothetical protein
MRHIIIHYHIFKNAGSTVDSILRNNFGDRCHNIEAANPWDTLGSYALLKHAEDNPSLEALSSHHARLPVPDSPDLVFHPLIFLRHPIDRAGSVYAFERRQRISSPSLGVKIAHENDFAGYVKWRLSKGHGAVIKNFQTVHLSAREGDMRVAVATDNDPKVALETISRVPFFGIVEFFDDSIARMSKYLSQHFRPLHLNYFVTNRSTKRKNTIQERLDDVQIMLGPDLYQELLEKNALDMQLYDYALKLFSSNNTE